MNAVHVEFSVHFFGAFHDNVLSPDDVDEHYPEGDLSGEGMRVEDAELSC